MIPSGSCPGTIGSHWVLRFPRYCSTSLPQIPHASTRSSPPSSGPSSSSSTPVSYPTHDNLALAPQVQLRERAVAVVVEGDQLVGIVNVEDDAGGDDQKADPHGAGEYRNEEPVADVGHDLPLAPPRRAGIAGPEMLEQREDHRQHEGDGDHLLDGLAEHQGDLHG